jgi:hypothetical protein
LWLLNRAAESPRIPRGLKKALAGNLYKNEQTRRDRISNKGLAALSALARPTSIPVHLHHETFEGVPYVMWETASLLDGSASLDVYFPTIQFPSFYNDSSLTREEEKKEEEELDIKEHRIRIDETLDSTVWNSILYTELPFRGMSSYQRPGLKTPKGIEKRGIPVRSRREDIKIPYFEESSLTGAREKARGIIFAYNPNKGPLEDIIDKLRNEEQVRREFSEHAYGNEKIARSDLLKRHGLPSDILPKVVGRKKEISEGVPFTIYHTKGGLIQGFNHEWYLGVIEGIKFPDHRTNTKIRETRRSIAAQVVDLGWEYAISHDPKFVNEIGAILVPKLSPGTREELRIVGAEIEEGTLVPVEEGPGYDGVKKDITHTIRAFKKKEEEVRRLAEAIGAESSLRDQAFRVAPNGWVSGNVDAVARVLGKAGFEYIVQNPVHLKRAEEHRAWMKRMGLGD